MWQLYFLLWKLKLSLLKVVWYISEWMGVSFRNARKKICFKITLRNWRFRNAIFVKYTKFGTG